MKYEDWACNLHKISYFTVTCLETCGKIPYQEKWLLRFCPEVTLNFDQ